MRRAAEKQLLPDPPRSSYLLSRLPSFPLSGLNTTNLAHCDAVWGGRQPPHLFWRISYACRRPISFTKVDAQPLSCASQVWTIVHRIAIALQRPETAQPGTKASLPYTSLND